MVKGSEQWYLQESARNGFPDRCPFAHETLCPGYFRTHKRLDEISSDALNQKTLSGSDTKKLGKHWDGQAVDLQKNAPSLVYGVERLFPGDTPDHIPTQFPVAAKRLCPEASFERLGVYATDLECKQEFDTLVRAGDQIEHHCENVTHGHFSSCALYDLLDRHSKGFVSHTNVTWSPPTPAPQKPGPAPNCEQHRLIAEVVDTFRPGWKKKLPAVCEELDKRSAKPPYKGRSRKETYGSWCEKADEDKDATIKSIEYSLKQSKS